MAYTNPNLDQLGQDIASAIKGNPTTNGISVNAQGKIEIDVDNKLAPLIKTTLEQKCTQTTEENNQPQYPGTLENLAKTIAGGIAADPTAAGITVVTPTAGTPTPQINIDQLACCITDILCQECPAACDPCDSAVPGDIRESVAIANVKSVAEQSAMLANLSFSNLLTNNNLSQQNAVSFQQSTNQLDITVTAKGVNRISDLGPLEAVSTTEVLTSNDLARLIAELRAVTAKGKPAGA